MADVEISYNNSVIATMTASGAETLDTEGKFLTGNIEVTYAGGASYPTYNGAHHQPVPIGYTVTISLTNPVNAGEFSNCNIMEQNTSTIGDAGNLLASITSASGSETVTISASIYGLLVVPNGMSVSVKTSGFSCTGGASYDKSDNMGGFIFAVTGNGTITMDGIDYDY